MKPGRFRTLVLHVSSRCDQTCAHCSIWKANGVPPVALSDAERATILEQSAAAGAAEVLFTGGEPLLCTGLENLCARARGLGLTVWIATNGLGLGRAAWVSELVDEVFVSLEGPEDLHDSVRGAGAWRRLREAVGALRMRGARPRATGRHVVTASSALRWQETVQAAQEIGLDALSFLPVDTTSEAFGGDPRARAPMKPNAETLAAFRASVRSAARTGWPRIIAESPDDLLAQADRLDGARPPRCNAPEWSVVVEADGRARPCFFQPAFGAWTQDRRIDELRASDEARAALAGLSPADRTCASCSCPKWRDAPMRAWARHPREAAGAYV